eukprot:TRINITY_DN6931_c0_g1_i5.p1 TRINITY_DN6931_c0_g1~~TRINITY_DN6931_c0_g1_i5.p1  ORF type:complete len:147 (+),score=33.04 TRINITY_DN6931_c0_g1_i5:485-925(+)
MTQKESHFMKALSCFERRVNYANLSGDFTVRYSTSAILGHILDNNNASSQRFEKYPNIFALEEVKPEIIEGKDNETSTEKEPRGKEEIVERMLKNLQSLSWVRITVKIDSWFLSHYKIISKPFPISMGKNADDVSHHLADSLIVKK